MRIEVLYAPTFQMFVNPVEEFKTTAVVIVDELIKSIEESRSPDGEYPDSDCIIKALQSNNSERSRR